jgi:hypothetical protein
MAPLDTAGWAHNGSGEIVNGQTRSPEGNNVFFKHAQELQGGDVWRMRVEVGGGAFVGFATEQHNVEKYLETYESTARVSLRCGTTDIYSDISLDGQEHLHGLHLRPHIPEAPYPFASPRTATFLRFNSTTTLRGTTLHRTGPH